MGLFDSTESRPPEGQLEAGLVFLHCVRTASTLESATVASPVLTSIGGWQALSFPYRSLRRCRRTTPLLRLRSTPRGCRTLRAVCGRASSARINGARALSCPQNFAHDRPKRTQYPRFRRFEPALMINLVDLWRTTSIRLIFASPDSICPLEAPAFARWFPPLLPMPPLPPLPPQTILAPRSARYTPASTSAVPASRCRDGFSPRKADASMITRTGCR
jgi:hypothetical protein